MRTCSGRRRASTTSIAKMTIRTISATTVIPPATLKNTRQDQSCMVTARFIRHARINVPCTGAAGEGSASAEPASRGSLPTSRARPCPISAHYTHTQTQREREREKGAKHQSCMEMTKYTHKARTTITTTRRGHPYLLGGEPCARALPRLERLQPPVNGRARLAYMAPPTL